MSRLLMLKYLINIDLKIITCLIVIFLYLFDQKNEIKRIKGCMIDEIVKNLEKGKYLLEHIGDEVYADCSIAPYNSSIGNHIRHILDMFSCIFKGYESKIVNLTLRERNLNAETYTVYGIEYFDTIISNLKKINPLELETNIEVVDDLGCGCCTVKSTFGAVLAQAQSHAIHHYATVGYMMHILGVSLPINSFGVNPTTPKKVTVKK